MTSADERLVGFDLFVCIHDQLACRNDPVGAHALPHQGFDYGIRPKRWSTLASQNELTPLRLEHERVPFALGAGIYALAVDNSLDGDGCTHQGTSRHDRLPEKDALGSSALL